MYREPGPPTQGRAFRIELRNDSTPLSVFITSIIEKPWDPCDRALNFYQSLKTHQGLVPGPREIFFNVKLASRRIPKLVSWNYDRM